MSYFSFELIDQDKPIVVFGRDGQVGRALQLCLKDLRVPIVFLGRADCDLSKEVAVRDILNYYEPQVIINAAAYTAVDKAEGERELAFAINAKAPAIMAHYIANVAHGILIHYSTDYVFSDTKQSAYLETDSAGPFEKLSAYGQSKLAGEQAIQENFNRSMETNGDSGKKIYQNQCSRYFILRTSWVYGDGENFIRSILRLASEQNRLKVVDDQIGAPSFAKWLAEVGLQISRPGNESGIYHAVPDGEISWHGLAIFAIETATKYGKSIKIKSENIMPIPTIDYLLPAPRPYNSRLSNAKLKKALSEMTFTRRYPHWREQVEVYIKEYVSNALEN